MKSCQETNKILKYIIMKGLLFTIIFSLLVLPVMAETSEDLQKILADKKMANQISSSLQKIKEEQTPNHFDLICPKADKALNILIKKNPELKPLLEKVQSSHKNLITFLASTNSNETDFQQTYKDLFYYLDSTLLGIWEISKIDKDLADTLEKIINHQYFFRALNIEVNFSGLILITTKYYRPSFYENMVIAQTSLKDQSSKTGYNKEWEIFIDDWLKKNNK